MSFRIKPFLNGGNLKWIAIITMMIDHTAAAVIRPLCRMLPDSMYGVRACLGSLYPYMRDIGRIAFPIFCFLLVEGFIHTRNAALYARRLFLFALISEFPFDFALSNALSRPHHQNVYFTLLIGLLVMIGMDYFENKRAGHPAARYLYALAQSLIAAGGLYLAKFLYTDYGFKGVLLIEVLYFYRNSRMLQSVFGAVAISWETTAPLAFIPVALYNGERGRQHKYFFYWFYPVHLLILGFLKLWITS